MTIADHGLAVLWLAPCSGAVSPISVLKAMSFCYETGLNATVDCIQSAVVNSIFAVIHTSVIQITRLLSVGSFLAMCSESDLQSDYENNALQERWPF